MAESEHDRRVSSRVEEILNGWWRRDGEKFRRCKTLDVSMDGALVVLDTELEDETAFEIHLDMDAEWSVALNAVVLWQRPIFFGRQQLTAVNYRFQQASDHSMFGLWMQRKLKSDAKKGLQEHLALCRRRLLPRLPLSLCASSFPCSFICKGHSTRTTRTTSCLSSLSNPSGL